MTSHKG